MLEVLKHNIYLPFYAVTWILSILKLPKYFDSILKYLPIIIGYTLFTELLGVLIYSFDEFSFFSVSKYSYYNVILYNIYDLIFFTFFLYIYWHSNSNKNIKVFIKFGAIIYIVILVTNAIYIDPLTNEMWYAYVFGVTILIFSVLSYLYALLFRSSHSPHYSNLLFWLSLGLLIFHIVYLPIAVIKNIVKDLNEVDYKILRNIHVYTIIIMYTCFIIGFLLMRRIRPKEI